MERCLYSDVLNPTFEPNDDTTLTVDEVRHINDVLDTIQYPLAVINVRQGRCNETPEKNVPRDLGCILLEEKHSTDGNSVYFVLPKKDVVFALYRNGKGTEYEFSKMEPYVVKATSVRQLAAAV